MNPADYFGRDVPAAWNRRLAEQEAAGSEGAELLAKMRAADFSLEICVPDAGDFHLQVRDGRMDASASPDGKALISLALGSADCAKLEFAVGASPMKLLGGVAGTPELILTPAKLETLREIEGTMRVQVTGDDAWGVTLHFGAPPVPDPTATVAIPEEEFTRLLAGELDLQGAFMTGKLEMEGDVEVPMKMAMAIMNPE